MLELFWLSFESHPRKPQNKSLALLVLLHITIMTSKCITVTAAVSSCRHNVHLSQQTPSLPLPASLHWAAQRDYIKTTSDWLYSTVCQHDLCYLNVGLFINFLAALTEEIINKMISSMTKISAIFCCEDKVLICVYFSKWSVKHNMSGVLHKAKWVNRLHFCNL